MPCLSRPISSQLPLITSALLYKVIFHTTGRICSAHAAESLESFNHHPASTVAPVWPLLQGQHSTGCIPAAPARLLGALGAHPLSKEKGGKPQAGGHTKQPCPARGAGRSSPCARRLGDERFCWQFPEREELPLSALHQLLTRATWLYLYFRSSQ